MDNDNTSIRPFCDSGTIYAEKVRPIELFIRFLPNQQAQRGRPPRLCGHQERKSSTPEAVLCLS